MGATVFVVDDDATQLNITESLLAKKCHYQTVSALGGKAAIERFLLRQSPKPDIILLDLIMPDVSGAEVVRAVRRSDPHIPIIMLAPPEQYMLMVEAIQAGANDCLRKPVNLQFLKMTIDKLLQREAMRAELCRLARYGHSDFRYEDVIARSDNMKQMSKHAKELSNESMPVCFEGEVGVGKELFARIMHNDGPHAQGEFVALTCQGDHPFFESLMQDDEETEQAQQPFAFSKSRGGTLFFRHLEKLTMQQQEALAAFLLNARASQDPQWLHVRFMASVLEPIAKLYREGRLHEKLYFYFSASSLKVAPLRDRLDDIEPLCCHYLKRFTATQPQMVNSVSADALAILKKQHWSENVSELMALIQRAAFQAHHTTLEAADVMNALDRSFVPTNVHVSPSGAMPQPIGQGQFSLLNMGGEVKPIEQLEAEVIRFAIEHYGGKMTEVAKKLGIGRSTLYRKMQDYKLRPAA